VEEMKKKYDTEVIGFAPMETINFIPDKVR
jgi:hypothetical protein